MRAIFRSLYIILWCVLICPFLAGAQQSPAKQMELTDFQLQSSYIINTPGDSLSSVNYHSKNYWFPIKVPSTVLTGLVANKVYPDPYIGMNNMLIPDASDSFNIEYHLGQYSYIPNHPNPWKKPYWYRTTFKVPGLEKGRHFELIFKGINYRAEVWLNGKEVADSSVMVGMFAQYNFDVSKLINTDDTNALAVKIYPLDTPGKPSHPQLDALGDFYANGGPTGDIGKNVTMLCSVGWDWMPAVRDRNIGIWQPVYLRSSGQVTIDRPQIITNLPKLPDTSIANISLHLNLTNHGEQPEKGKLSVKISPESFSGSAIAFDKEISVDAGVSAKVDLTPDNIKQLIINQPKLWWPNGYGSPNLYRINLQYSNGNDISDDTSFVFGIRTVSSKAVDVNGWTRRDFYVNGRRIHLDGGAWVPDMMLNRDSLRYDNEIRLCRNANINLLRIWGGGIAPPDMFFNLADRYGMLVWQDFWITGDTHGEFKGSPDWPVDGSIYIRNIISTIYRLRNHPSLLLWTGGNEGHARKELYDAMRNNVAGLDGTRPFIPSSSGFAKLPKGWKGSWPDDNPSGVYSGGPYSWQDPAHYYDLVDRGKDWVFKDETGIPSQPPYETLPKIVPNLVPDSSLPYPLNNTWGYHDACSGNGKYDLYYNALVDRYGTPESMKDYSEKTQLLNANGYRGIFEAAGHKLNETGGVMLWKLNAAFPSMIWQIYDWYLEPNAGYYFMQRAVEPVHIQLNLDDSTVALINRSYNNMDNLTAEISVVDMQGKSLFHQVKKASLADTSVKEIQPLASVLARAQGITFVILNLKNAAGNIISHNIYWFAPGNDYKDLKKIPSANINVKVVKSANAGNDRQWTLEFSNPGSQLAFFINPQIINSKNGEEILPSFWSDNYFSLAPHQSLEVKVNIPEAELKGKAQLKVEGWNLEKQVLYLPDKE